ncbi:hypothetical protein [Spongiibacter sp.]|uniref:hypothetical protein n=1 Tax=Spongiibacter sp. TaxID=2024860 RepID=UPI0035613801
MDLTHGDVLHEGRRLLSDVPMYILTDEGYSAWSGCLHLQSNDGELLNGVQYSIRLRDGRLGSIRIRKVISTNGAHHIEVLFEGLGQLEKRCAV